MAQARHGRKVDRRIPSYAHAAAATTGAAGGASTFGSSDAGAAAGVASVASAAGFSRGATGVGSSIFGGFSSTLGGVLCSALGLGLKKSPTRAERRRPILAFFSASFFSSFSSFYNLVSEQCCMNMQSRLTFSSLGASVSAAVSAGASVAGASAGAAVSLRSRDSA